MSTDINNRCNTKDCPDGYINGKCSLYTGSPIVEPFRLRPNTNFNDTVKIISNYLLTLSPGDGGDGTKIAYPAGEPINSHTPVALISNYLYKYDYGNPLHQFSFVGFTKTSAGLGEVVVIERERITLTGWGLIPNTNYLAGPNGTMLLENTDNTKFTKIIGFAETENTLLIHRGYTPVTY